jgi:hypothetical protein
MIMLVNWNISSMHIMMRKNCPPIPIMLFVSLKSICFIDGAYFLYLPLLNAMNEIIIVSRQGIPEKAMARYSRLPSVVYVSVIIVIRDTRLPTVFIAVDAAGRWLAVSIVEKTSATMLMQKNTIRIWNTARNSTLSSGETFRILLQFMNLLAIDAF